MEQVPFLKRIMSLTTVFCTKAICVICSGSRELEYTITLHFSEKKKIAFMANFINIIPVGFVADPIGAGKSDLIP